MQMPGSNSFCTGLACIQTDGKGRETARLTVSLLQGTLVPLSPPRGDTPIERRDRYSAGHTSTRPLLRLPIMATVCPECHSWSYMLFFRIQTHSWQKPCLRRPRDMALFGSQICWRAPHPKIPNVQHKDVHDPRVSLGDGGGVG